MENFRNFGRIVEEEEATLPRYRDSEGQEWLDHGHILRLCSERSCRMMPKPKSDDWAAQLGLTCIKNCPEQEVVQGSPTSSTPPVNEQHGGSPGQLPGLSFEKMHSMTRSLMKQENFNIQALALMGNLYHNKEFDQHISIHQGGGIEYPDNAGTLIHRFKPGRPGFLQSAKAADYVRTSSEREAMFANYLKRHGMEISVSFTRDLKNPSLMVKATPINPAETHVSPAMPQQR